ncbi:hypothetical protein EON65_28420 [archaeon]|nr:MAG: hypothetical protein EON65_28420 [archaeon]
MLCCLARQEGVSALYAGMQARILWSTLYGAIGLTTFELSKKLLSLQSTESTLQYK